MMILVSSLVILMGSTVYGASKPKKPSIGLLMSREACTITLTTSWDGKASGYEISASQKQSFSNAKKKIYSGKRLWKKHLAGLKGNKVYYVRVRAFAKKNGRKIFGKYSKKKRIKVAGYVTGYVRDHRLYVNKKKKGNSGVVVLSYKDKVQVSLSLKARSKREWIKLRYKGKTRYLYCKKNVSYFFSKGFRASDYKNLNVGIPAQKAVDLAVDIMKNKKTVYKNTANITPGSKDSKGRMRFDCSGFTSFVLSQVMKPYVPNYDVSNGIAAQGKNAGYLYTDAAGRFSVTTVCNTKKKPDFSKLKPGDLVFFNDNTEKITGALDHVGIYVGGKEFIHSVKSENGVVLMPMGRGRYKDRFLFAKRFMPKNEPAPMNRTMFVDTKGSGTKAVYKDIKFNEQNGDRLADGEEVTLLFRGNCRYDSSFETCYIEYGNGRRGYMKSTFLTASPVEGA